MKLSHQFKSGESGGKRIADTVGAGAADWDDKAKALIPKEIRMRAKHGIKDMLAGSQNSQLSTLYGGKSMLVSLPISDEDMITAKRKKEEDAKEEAKSNENKGVFDGLVIYINGSTHPVVSDHKLKHLLAENGAKLSIHLGRRSVTHVILGKPAGSEGSGAGGGLSGTKFEKEIRRVGGCGIRYVGVEW